MYNIRFSKSHRRRISLFIALCILFKPLPLLAMTLYYLTCQTWIALGFFLNLIFMDKLPNSYIKCICADGLSYIKKKRGVN